MDLAFSNIYHMSCSSLSWTTLTYRNQAMYLDPLKRILAELFNRAINLCSYTDMPQQNRWDQTCADLILINEYR